VNAAAEGERRIRWVSGWMPVLDLVSERLRADGILAGRRIAVVLPVEPKTAYFATVLAEGGADVTVAFQGSMVDDDVAAGLAARGVTVLARSGSTHEEELAFFGDALSRRPEVVIDDRATLVRLAHTTHPESLETLVGAAEETTSGVVQLRAMEADGTLRVPCITTNDARCKQLFDNRYGTGQSAVNAILDRTNLLAADKDVVVVGYGWVGKGLAARLRGLAARVTVCEVDPFAALEAHHDGFDVAPLAEACHSTHIVISATGVRSTIGPDALEALPDGALLANAGAVDDEIDVAWLRDRATETHVARDAVEEFVLDDGRSLFLVGGGIVVNLSAAEGHPAEIMDLTFAAQALAAAHLLEHGAGLAPRVHPLPVELDESVARLALGALGRHRRQAPRDLREAGLPRTPAHLHAQ
jgi:adenosylhomocysteinase